MFDAGSIIESKDEDRVVEEVIANLAEVNHSLTFDVFTKETSDLLSEVRALKNVWEEYKGRIYCALNASPLEVFMLSFYSSFFIPKMMIVRDDLDSELDLSKSLDPDGKNASTVLSIDYDGPLIRLDDGSFLIPPYQAFSLSFIKLESGVLHIGLRHEKELKEEEKIFTEDQIVWLQKRAEMTLSKQYLARGLNYQFSTLRSSFKRTFR